MDWVICSDKQLCDRQGYTPENKKVNYDYASCSCPPLRVICRRLCTLDPRSSGSTSNPLPQLLDSLNTLRRLRVGDGAREVAGEKTPTPDSFSLENIESSSAEKSANPLPSSCVTPLQSGGVLPLLSSLVDSEKPGDDDEMSSMWMDGIASLGMTGLSVVDALATSTTPSVRATTYDDIS
jgi:hypothetical protein